MSTHFSMFAMSNSMEIRLSVLSLFHESRRTDASSELSKHCPGFRRCQKRNKWRGFEYVHVRSYSYCKKTRRTCRPMFMELLSLTKSAHQALSYFTNSQPFSEPDRSLLHWHVHQWPLSWARWTQSTPFYHIALRFISMLSFQLHQGLPHGLFPSDFGSKLYTYYSFLKRQLHVTPISYTLIWLP
jgi:hypothetical protein